MAIRLRHASLSVRIIVPVVFVLILCVSALLGYLWRAASRQTAESSLLSAQATVTQFKTLRAYYTAQVVNKVKTAGGLDVTYDHADKPNAIPLPATMIHDLSELLSRDASGTRIRLYSRHPFPNRRGRELDGFAAAALDALQADPDAVYVRSESVEGRAAIRVAVADKMAVAACVSCHNAHPQSPKKDWRLNDVRGALEVIVPIDRQMAATRSMLANVVALAALGLSGVVVVLVWFTRRSVTRPIQGVISELRAGARQVSSASALVAASAQSLSQGATEQAASLEETSASMTEMASMTRQNADSVQVAVSVVAETERFVQGADVALGEMVTSMTAIRDSAGKVGKIIKTIDEIAFQTNILALNAAVEAARAGTAGQGFAVVADEVRSLAQRSARAARETSALIEESIACSVDGQGKVAEVSSAMLAIGASSARVRELVGEVASASRQQAEGIAQVSQAIDQMETVTQSTAATAEESAAASEELSAHAETAMTLVGELSALVAGRRAAESVARASVTAANEPMVPTGAGAQRIPRGSKIVSIERAAVDRPADRRSA
jgi:hypothetical protein